MKTYIQNLYKIFVCHFCQNKCDFGYRIDNLRPTIYNFDNTHFLTSFMYLTSDAFVHPANVRLSATWGPLDMRVYNINYTSLYSTHPPLLITHGSLENTF